MDIPAIVEWVTVAKGALESLKIAKSLLPAGEKADKVQAQIDKAEADLLQAQAVTAKTLGFRLCRCEFPPPIMLWDKNRRKSVCQKCGDVYPPERKPIAELQTRGPWNRR
jgi:hypothetical protein